MNTPHDYQHPKRPVGRPPGPTKLTPDLTDRLCALISAGLCLRQACYGCGITPQSVYCWMTASQEGTVEPFATFFWRIKKARVACELFWLEQLKTRRSWQRWAWLLERSFPAQWRQRNPKPREKPPDPPQTGDDIIAEIEAVLAENRNGAEQTL